MASFPSHRNMQCYINGFEMNTWAQEDPPYTVSPKELVRHYLGQDGKLYGLSISDRTGILTLHLAPHAPAVQWFQQRLLEAYKRDDEQRRRELFSGTMCDPERNYDVILLGGALLSCPQVTIPGQTFSPTMIFEQVLPNPDRMAVAPRFDENGV